MPSDLTGTAADYFGGMVESYDALIERAVPRYHEMTARLLDILPGEPARILELGCGTGNLSLALAARFPAARITFLDASPEMVAITRARVARQSPDTAARAGWAVARFEALDAARGSFDLVTSCISLHHVADKGALYRAIRAVLAPGGTFRFADQMAGGSPWNHEHAWREWLAFCRAPGHCDEATVHSLVEHARLHDHYTPVAEHFRLLEAAGFTALDCVWRSVMWGILTADVPADA